MEPIRDLTWMAQRAFGTLERFELNGWQALAVSGSRVSADRRASGASPPQGPKGPYLYRILFFSPASADPLYAVNLEATILGDWALTEQTGRERHVWEHLGGPLNYDQFRIKALERALQRLPAAGPEPEVPKKKAKVSRPIRR